MKKEYTDTQTPDGRELLKIMCSCSTHCPNNCESAHCPPGTPWCNCWCHSRKRQREREPTRNEEVLPL